ncbi:hypothetical protein [Bacillus cereus]|uniref:hypothetical protein n=1 Tax=unclassified Bacillus cereus group TaxID=2750818 RepID=UPI000941E026
MELTPREFENLMIGRNEQHLDELQTNSVFALMMRVAYHHDPKKKLKPCDLFDRNKLNGENTQDLTIEEKMKKAQEHMQFLQTLNFN